MKKYNATLRNISYRLRSFKDNLPFMLEDIIKSNADVIISMIADDQLYDKGINGLGKEIMDYRPYTASTIRKKRKRGQPADRVTLRDTGDFHKSMYIVFEPDGFYITSSDYKTKYLISRYKEEIFRLTNENLTKLIRSCIKKELIKRLKQTAKQ